MGLVLVLLLAFSTSVVIAQEPDSSSAQSTIDTEQGGEISTGTAEPVQQTSSPRPIEEITVVGQQSLFRLRRLVIEKEDEVFAYFNANNSSNRMDIICGKRVATGTYVPRRVCEPRFLKNLRSYEARSWRRGFTTTSYSQQDLLFESKGDFDQLQSEINELMLSSEEFANILADYADLTDNYAAHRAAMFKKD
jgi:hypothetical protein|tara:strand:- start:1872 stop:2450 length:579 start_codon:yes stop_codon:yes gene_type:complete